MTDMLTFDETKNHTPRTSYETHSKKGTIATIGMAALLGAAGATHFLRGPERGLDSKQAIANELGHVPKGIDTITPTKTKDVVDVRYTAQPVVPGSAEAQVSAIAADLHLLAPNQDQTAADSAIDTYLPKADQPRYQVHIGEDFNFLVNTKTGEILPKPAKGDSAQR
jgi:hypothetical protein